MTAPDRRRQQELMTGPQLSLYQFLRPKVRQPQMLVTEHYPMPADWRGRVIGEETLE